MATKRITKYFNRPLCPPVGCEACARRAIEDRDKLALVELPKQLPRKGEIDQMGMGAEVVRLRASGMTHEEIGRDLKLSTDQVQHWLRKYQELSIDERKTIQHRSIFDLADRLQEVFEMVYQELVECRNAGNREMSSKNLKLLLQAIDQGGRWQERMYAQQEDRRYKAAMLQVMEDMAPGTKAQVVKALMDMDLNTAMVRRLT